MLFILQKSVYDKINADITTKKGKSSISMQLKHLYIINRLNYVSIHRKDNYLKGVSMSTELLTNLFSNGSEVKSILNRLERFELITKVRESKLHEYSARYILHKSIANERVYMHDFCSSDSALINKLEEHNDSVKIFIEQLKTLKDYVSINNSGKEYFKRKYGMIQNDLNFAVEPSDLGLKAIYDNNFYATRPDIKSRVYSNLTSLARDQRKYIEINGRPMLMTDISNSQILLTVPLLHNYWSKKSGKGLINLPDDVNTFQKLAESGKFYEYIANCISLNFNNDTERSDFKKKIFEEIWFSKNSQRLTAVKKAFKQEFPTVFSIIWKLKEAKYNEFAIKLQRFEASILVDKVWKKMYKLGKIVFTLHDAIICDNEENLFLAEKLIESELLKFGLVPKFKREVEEIYQMAA